MLAVVRGRLSNPRPGMSRIRLCSHPVRHSVATKAPCRRSGGGLDLGAAYRNRTDDLYITSASDHRTPAFRTVHLRRQIAVSASPGTTLRWQELSRQLSRSLQHHSPSLRSGPLATPSGLPEGTTRDDHPTPPPAGTARHGRRVRRTSRTRGTPARAGRSEERRVGDERRS